MQNDEGVVVDMYIPRKCTATGSLITAKDHAAVQINIGDVDEHGLYTGSFKTVAFCGQVRKNGQADDSMNRYCLKTKIMRDIRDRPSRK